MRRRKKIGVWHRRPYSYKRAGLRPRDLGMRVLLYDYVTALTMRSNAVVVQISRGDRHAGNEQSD